MADTTNLFKFVAVRPAQLANPRDTRRTVIRDGRAGTPDGLQQLAVRAREFTSHGGALAHWRGLDLRPIEPLARGQHELVRGYEALSAGEATPPAARLLQAAGLADLRGGGDKGLLEKAWDALYAAHATGADAGTRLETPMAALRALHFASLLVAEPNPTPALALEALGATVVITPALDEVLRPATSVDSASASAAAPGSSPGRLAKLQELANELRTADALLSALTSAPAVVAPSVETSAPQAMGEWSRHEVSVTTIPALRAALPPDLTRRQIGLLDRLGVTHATSVPAAAQTLQAHVGRLSDQALEVAGDREFQAILNTQAGAAPPTPPPDVDVSGRITPLGIGDLKVVKQTLLAYVPGEVAHIENVLKGEFKERIHRNLDWTETTLSTLEEETRDTERDTQSTDRFELKRETEQTIKEDMSIKAGLTVTAAYGPVVATATGDFAYSTSKSESQKSSSNFAREVVDRSVSKIQTKTRTERTTKTHSEVEETNTHGVDNKAGAEHVIGVYRWVDKRYRAQIYNYGIRLMFEFVVPEPAAFYRAARAHGPVKIDATPPAPFLNDLNPLQRITNAKRLTADDIGENNYKRYAARYGASGVTPPPVLFKYIGAAIAKDALDKGTTASMTSKDFVVPDGYSLNYYSATVSIVWVNFPSFSLQVGSDLYRELPDVAGGARMTVKQEGLPNAVTPINGPVPVSVASYDVGAFAVNVQGVCKRDDRTLTVWQLQTYEKILTAYQAQQTAYDQKLAQAQSVAAGITIEGHNPASNRMVERTELKKLCITMMTGQHFGQFDAIGGPADKPEVDVNEALREGPIVQFLEQAFEWEHMTYLFYPYFWGRKANWGAISNLSDPDPLFEQFLTAGACRVLVPVPLQYEASVRYLLQTKTPDLSQKVWNGGEPVTIESPLFISIADELRNQTDDLAGAKPDPDSQPWEYTLPTTLVWLQPDSKLPTFT